MAIYTLLEKDNIALTIPLSGCSEDLDRKELKENLYVCVNCNFHFRMSAEERIKLFFEDGNYDEILPDKIYFKLIKKLTKYQKL